MPGYCERDPLTGEFLLDEEPWDYDYFRDEVDPDPNIDFNPPPADIFGFGPDAWVQMPDGSWWPDIPFMDFISDGLD